VTNRESGSFLSGNSSVTVHAPAKINLVLRILDRRLDRYHNLWSVMQTVALEDEVQIRAASTQGIRLTCDTEALAVDCSNLVYKAASAVLDEASVSVGLDLELRKRIPMGAGLGGGSSDAAATILGLNQLLQLGWSRERMQAIAGRLGSDVPFFFYAPTAVVSGRGEAVKPVWIDAGRWVVLVKPEFGVETNWAYQELAATRTGTRPLSSAHRAIDRHSRLTWTELVTAAENDFEAPVFARYPVLREIKETLTTEGADLALLSGSGATLFGIFGDESAARRAHAHLAQDQRLQVFVIPTCSEPVTVS
jgi:4-diphosphocytidyl-2-C-methyl-D-erythritol kinase